MRLNGFKVIEGIFCHGQTLSWPPPTPSSTYTDNSKVPAGQFLTMTQWHLRQNAPTEKSCPWKNCRDVIFQGEYFTVGVGIVLRGDIQVPMVEGKLSWNNFKIKILQRTALTQFLQNYTRIKNFLLCKSSAKIAEFRQIQIREQKMVICKKGEKT